MSNEKNLPYAVVCGGVNIDIGAHSFAPLRAKDSNPGKVELSLGGVGRNIAHNMRLRGLMERGIVCDLHAGEELCFNAVGFERVDVTE